MRVKLQYNIKYACFIPKRIHYVNDFKNLFLLIVVKKKGKKKKNYILFAYKI